MRIEISATEKRIRAQVIKEHMERHGIKHAVCFSCGNSSSELKRIGVPLLDISPQGDMRANRWFTQEDIRELFPEAFDATSGHLPIDMLNQIAARIRQSVSIEQATGCYEVPTGSGETIVVLSLAFPTIQFKPIYNENDSTRYEEQAPLNLLVEAVTKKSE